MKSSEPDNNESKSVQSLCGYRIFAARTMRGYCLSELARKIEHVVCRQTLNKYEQGILHPTAETLQVIADALEMDIHYFMRPLHPKIEHVQMRLPISKKGVIQHSCEEQIRDYCERYLEIEELLGLATDFEPIDMDVVKNLRIDAVKRARQLRERWQLGDFGISSVMNLLESHHIKTIAIEAPDTFRATAGFLADKRPFIVVNQSLPTEHKRLAALQELGHILLPTQPGLPENIKEHLCFTFATEMLITGNALRYYLGFCRKEISIAELRYIQAVYGIPIDCLMLKIKRYGIIPPAAHRNYLTRKREDPAFAALTDENVFHTSQISRMERLVARALTHDIITPTKAAALLNCSVEKLLKDKLI